jgi:hypothetical protein
MVAKGWHRPDHLSACALAANASAAGEPRDNGHRDQSADRYKAPELRNEANYPGNPMTSFRRIAANRRNASKSTGPKTQQGKQRARCNAIRHGLTAETVIRALEDAEDYRAFEAAIVADYDAQSA